MNILNLPTELQQLAYSHMDLESLVNLSKTSKDYDEALTDDFFKTKLKEVCPWFEPVPECSHRTTWKECAVEHLRRQQEGASFARTMTRVTKEEFGAGISVDSVQGTYIGDSSFPITKCIYTSSQGITLDMTEFTPQNLEEDWYRLELQPKAHVLVVFLRQGTHEHCALVKFKDSEGTQPDFVHTLRGYPRSCTYTSATVLGNHVFVTFDSDPQSGKHSEVVYMNKNQVVFSRDYETEDFLSFTCYDGLFLFADNGTYYSVSASLDNDKPPLDHSDEKEEYFKNSRVLHFPENGGHVYLQNGPSRPEDFADVPEEFDEEGFQVLSDVNCLVDDRRGMYTRAEVVAKRELAGTPEGGFVHTFVPS